VAAAIIGAVFTVVMGAIAFMLGVFNLRDRVWPKPTGPHPLEPVLADIAAALREGFRT
jgi:hypothetical protein